VASARRWPSQAAFGRGRFPALPRPDRWGRPPGSRRRGRRRALRAPPRPPAPRSARGWTARGAPRGRRGPSPLSTQPSASSSGVGLRPNSAVMVANTAWAFATLPPTWTGTRLAVPRSRVPRSRVPWSRMPRWAFGDRFPSASATGTFGAGEAGSFGGPTAYFNCSRMRCGPRCERRCLPRRSAAGRGHTVQVLMASKLPRVTPFPRRLSSGSSFEPNRPLGSRHSQLPDRYGLPRRFAREKFRGHADQRVEPRPSSPSEASRSSARPLGPSRPVSATRQPPALCPPLPVFISS
jgi:hypothetical protein